VIGDDGRAVGGNKRWGMKVHIRERILEDLRNQRYNVCD
jgi:hypothetical protein